MIRHPIVGIKPKVLKEPVSTPPVPAEVPTFSSSHKMSPYLLLYPIFHIAQTSAGVAYPKVVNPVPKLGIDQFDHRLQWLRCQLKAGYSLRHE